MLNWLKSVEKKLVSTNINLFIIVIPNYNSELTPSFFAATFMEQLAVLGVKPGNQDSSTKSIVALKNEQAKEKLAQEKAQADTYTLSRAIEEIMKMADQLTADVPSLQA
jgi:hypothetical protein